MKHIGIPLFTLLLALSLGACANGGKVKKEPLWVDYRAQRISVGTIETQFETLMGLGAPKKTDITVEYYPEEDAVCLLYRYDFYNYKLFWDKEGRGAYVKALEQYKDDYEQRRLKSRGSKKTKRAYGTVEGFLYFQASALTTRGSGNPAVELGYFLKTISDNRTSFFTVNQRQIQFTNIETGDNSPLYSKEVLFLFSRAQADELAAFFDQDLLDGLAAGSSQRRTQDTLDQY
jgi:hypothetical protein